jgi:hypothetical protein
VCCLFFLHVLLVLLARVGDKNHIKRERKIPGCFLTIREHNWQGNLGCVLCSLLGLLKTI